MAKEIDMEVVSPSPAILVELDQEFDGTYIEGVAVKDFLTDRKNEQLYSIHSLYLDSSSEKALKSHYFPFFWRFGRTYTNLGGIL